MIHDELVTYEVAWLAKVKGFPQDPNENNLCDIYCWDNLRKIHTLCISAMWDIGEYSREDMYAAPTQSLLQRWLREEKGEIIEMKHSDSTESWRLFWSWRIYNNLGFIIRIGNTFDTYELALEDALKYALENLV